MDINVFIIKIKNLFFKKIRSFLVKGTFPQYKPPETHSIINSKLNPDIYGKMKSFSQKNFLLENIKKSKQSPEKKKQEESKYSKLVERTFLNTLSKVDLSKTSINVFTNKDLLNKKKNEKLDPLVLNSFKLKTASDGFQK